MKPEEISLIKSKQNAAIIAPAGHGKTEMIVDLVEHAERKALLVTHTNAGVDALVKRLKKRNVGSNKYSITTIAGFCLRWSSAYPKTADIRDIPVDDNDYYPMLYDGTFYIFKNTWARKVLQNTYSCVIVDEYQDCIIPQHLIFLEINKSIPVIVFGDPLQAIFGWAGCLVSWKNLGFDIINVETHPWRWNKTNPKLGEYLCNIRSILEPGLNGQNVTINVESIEKCIRVLPTSYKHNISPLLSIIKTFENTAYITNLKSDQEKFSHGTGGIFQNDETQNIKELLTNAAYFDKREGSISAKCLFVFLSQCATNVTTELMSYSNNINKGNFDFGRIKKYPEFGELIKKVYNDASNQSIIAVLDWIRREKAFRIFRKELISEMRRALVYSNENSISIYDAAQKIRTLPGLQRRYAGFRFLSSRTLLLKGLEFDCVIIDLEKGMTVTDYYVALTRARKYIFIISDKKSIVLCPPKNQIPKRICHGIDKT